MQEVSNSIYTSEEWQTYQQSRPRVYRKEEHRPCHRPARRDRLTTSLHDEYASVFLFKYPQTGETAKTSDILGQFLLQMPTVSRDPPPSSFVWKSLCRALPTARRRASTSGHDCQTW